MTRLATVGFVLGTLFFLSGCNDRMVRIVEYGGVDPIIGEVRVGGCKVETSELPIDGDLLVTYLGDKCVVEYSRDSQ